MQLQAALVKIVCGVSLLAGLSLLAHASNYDCTQLMYDHGLATSAQMNCGYNTPIARLSLKMQANAWH